MRLKELKELLQGYDETLEVVIEVRTGDVQEEDWFSFDEWDGQVLDVTDERSITVSYNQLHILGDLNL